ncbi:glycosyltransferase family 4 protein [Mycolicibacterium sp. 018/SC-01/001]|uniref:glycosyltransferase family 4 protein n=1 Tax=Mycolicibacterium sp. 018/SC-01/001 TaxID=2592069 RepID=UPI00117D0AEF|nr:glycosyltransferase family 1 protein [Mycolicibacterium sp. 018/SC-01/001]TRW80452.1 glycosyltransferase family 4 protein [Mycolicibacterium sp. 018/SC-01/001]
MTDRRVDLLFDARHIRQSGVGTYIATLLPSLEETFAERGLSLAILVNEHAVPDVRHARIVTAAPAAMYTVGEQRVWGRALDEVRPRGFWTPHYPFPFATLSPRHRGTKLFVTVHDTMHVREREISGQSAARRAYARAMFMLDGRFATLVLTPSEATVRTFTGIAPGARTTTTPIPVDAQWFEPVDRALSPVAEPFILYVGNAKWHKNLPLLLMAFGDVVGDIPHRLVIAGSGEALRGGDERVPALAAALRDRVEVMGRLDFDVLRALVASADLLVMPSLHEGAGLPPIEAMASHTAVIAADIPALRETCGDGADYFDPTDRSGLAAVMRSLCTDGDARERLAERGWAHVTNRQKGLSLTPAAEAVASALA